MRRSEAMGRPDKQARAFALILREVIDDIVLVRNDDTYRPQMRFDGRGIRAFWSPIDNGDSGDWETCLIEVHERRPPEDLQELLLACEVVPGVYGPRAQIDWRGAWKTRVQMYYEVEAAVDNRSVNYLIQFDPDEKP